MASCSIVLIVGLVSLCISTVMSLLACVIKEWAKTSGPLKVSTGLWEVCHQTFSLTYICRDIKDPPEILKTTRGLVIASIICTGMTVIFSAIHAKKSSLTGVHSTRTMVNVVSFSGFIAVILMLACSIHFGVRWEEEYGNHSDLGDAFYVFNVAIFFGVVGTIAVAGSYKRHSLPSGNGGTGIPTAPVVYRTAPQQFHHHGGQVLSYGNQPPANPGMYPTHGYPTYTAGNPPTYPATTYPVSTYPATTYPATSYPAPSNPPPSYPATSYPPPSNPPPSYPATTYPAPTNPAPSYPAHSNPEKSNPVPSYPAPSYPEPNAPAYPPPSPVLKS